MFASLLELWIELLMHWGRLIDFTSGSSQLLDGYLLHDISSSPNFIITFLFGNIVWESTVANSCIGQLLKVVLPHLILVAQICVCIIIGSLDRVLIARDIKKSCKTPLPPQICCSLLHLATYCESHLHQLLCWALTQDRATSFLRSILLISHLLLAFVLSVIFWVFG